MKLLFRAVFFELGKVSLYFLPTLFFRIVTGLFHNIHSGRIAGQLLYCGRGPLFLYPCYIKGPEYIRIGEGFRSAFRLRLEAWDFYLGTHYQPLLEIGNNVSLSDNCHIGCINSVVINDDVLIGSNVFITDHYHGEVTSDVLDVVPISRRLVSKGPVRIGKNVWIGDGVVILPNVDIGDNCIVGANSVVNKSFGPGQVIAGVPAVVVRDLNR